MAIAQMIAQSHGTRINLKSRPGQGTVATVTLEAIL
jgi:signal transduction histidine kinase